MQVHVDRNGTRYGPYSLEEINAHLANGTLLPTDIAWQDGMAGWVPIGQIPGVSLSKDTPPVAGATCPQCEAPVEGIQVVCMGCGTHLQGAPTTAKDSRKKVLIGIGAGLGALAVIAGGLFFLVRDRASPPPIDEAKKPAQFKYFNNTLGMKFVAVPGTDVQFCIWETRVKDYAAYAGANAGVDGRWKKPSYKDNFGGDVSFTQKETHPVVMVSWNDAQAVCTWLTQKELAEGKIKTGQSYRLPTDAEWSVAVGLGKETGSCPMEKHKGVEGVYPWGKEWPPPWEAGNYMRDKVAGLGPEADQFDYTSPVGSFAANKHGLHDLGGNAEEWCEDKNHPGSRAHVLRGASWTVNIIIPDSRTLSSYRDSFTPDWRRYNWGFRCVLAGGAGQ